MTLLTKPLLPDGDMIKEKNILIRYIGRDFVTENVRIQYRYWNNFTLVGLRKYQICCQPTYLFQMLSVRKTGLNILLESSIFQTG